MLSFSSSSTSEKKIRVNDIAALEFLKSFTKQLGFSEEKYNLNNLLEIQKELIQLVCPQKEIENIKIILGKILALSCNSNHIFEIENPNDAQLIYTNLMTVFSSDNIKLDPSINTPNLDKIYTALFNENLYLIDVISKKLETETMYKHLGEIISPKEKSRDRFQKILGEKTLGIFNESGNHATFTALTHPESNLSKLFSGLLGFDYAPTLYNNIPYAYDEKLGNTQRPVRRRLGTPVTSHRNMTKLDTKIGRLSSSVSQSFLNFLTANSRNNQDKEKIDYVYINLQKLKDDTEKSKKPAIFNERLIEHNRFLVLQRIEENSHVALITLPADNKYFVEGFDKKHGKPLLKNKLQENFQPYDVLLEEIIDSIKNNKHDVYISNRIKAKLFENIDDLHKEIAPLFEQALTDILGSNADHSIEKISMSQRQAILFHFYKHYFTEFIIRKLQPISFNISCKDAIDRGGIHNLWNILCLHIDNGLPFSLQDFEAYLNIPAILVKDRPVNEHINLLINVLGHYYYHLAAEKQALIPWVPAWLESNSYYKEKSAAAYQWSYKDDSSIVTFKELHPENYSDLYRAVTSGDIGKVLEILNNNQNLSIWDGTQQTDTILLGAIRNNRFDIFNILIFHLNDKNPAWMQGMRTERINNYSGNALNYLFAHLLEMDVDNIIDETSVHDTNKDNPIITCIRNYLESVIQKKPPKINSFKDYTNVIDEYDMQPMDYLAILGNIELLREFAQLNYSGYTGTYKVTDIFELKASGSKDKTIMDIALENGHMEFAQELLKVAPNLYTQAELDQAEQRIRKETGQEIKDLQRKDSAATFRSRSRSSSPRDNKSPFF